MTYKELEERINQQGTQCGVNLMSSAVLEVECTTNLDDISFIADSVVEAFRRDSDESFEDILSYMYELSQHGKLPTIEAVYRDNEANGISRSKILATVFNHNEDGDIRAEMSWVFEDSAYRWEY